MDDIVKGPLGLNILKRCGLYGEVDATICSRVTVIVEDGGCESQCNCSR